VVLDDGSRVRVGYADQNGHPYRAIGRDLIEMGEIAREAVSLQTIRDWLRDHPERADEVMGRNASYVFFHELADGDGPLGAQGVPLTALRSLAVDFRFIPYGLPLWLEVQVPWPEGDAPLRQLMVAQDTGGAIRGPVRGDVFWGEGPRALHIAGHMRHPGRYWLLLPRSLSPVG
jgi:membrane-bound lytic murein transglycosylase A